MGNVAVSNKCRDLNKSDLFNTFGDMIPTYTMGSDVLAVLDVKSDALYGYALTVCKKYKTEANKIRVAFECRTIQDATRKISLQW